MMIQPEDKNFKVTKNEECFHKNYIPDEELKSRSLKQQMIFDQQQRDIQVESSLDGSLSPSIFLEMFP